MFDETRANDKEINAFMESYIELYENIDDIGDDDPGDIGD